ncbi:MAG: hypothetical protein ABII68_12285 [Pseudomonadota bacterium]
MAKLVMVLRCLDGIVIGGDVPPGTILENEAIIRPLSDFVAIIIHDNTPFGDLLLSEYLASSPKLDAPIKEINEQVRKIFDRKCAELHSQGEKVPFPMGIIIAGIDDNGKGKMVFSGLHVGRRFKPIDFKGNLFGGECNAIARLLDKKIHSFNISVERGLQHAAFYFTETRSVPAIDIHSGLSLAQITHDDGFRAIESQKAKQYIKTANRWSESFFGSCSSLFTPIPDNKTKR